MNQLAVITMVRNEADVIESFVRHALLTADAVCVIDHASTDATGDILQSLQDEGLPLTVCRYDGAAQVQAELLNELMEQAFAAGADLVLPLDADEFLWPGKAEGSMAGMRNILQQLDPARVYAMDWVTCQAQVKDGYLPQRAKWRAQQPEPIAKILIGRAAWQATHCQITQGNHQAVVQGEDGMWQRIVPERVEGVFLAHFPWRSREQAAAKAAVGWLANVAKYSCQTDRANHWRAAFQALQQGTWPEQPKLAAPQKLAVPPEDQRIGLRYTASQPIDVLSRVLTAGEQIAEGLRETQVLHTQPLVSVILPYAGDLPALQQSWASLQRDGYPYEEYLILPMAAAKGEPDGAGRIRGEDLSGGGVPTEDARGGQAALMDFLSQAPARGPVMLLQGGTMDARLADLRQSIHGDYIQWLLPGDQLLPGKLTKMVTSLASNENIDIVLSNGVQAQRTGRPDILELPVTETFMLGDGTQLANCLAEGHRLSGGLCAMLIRRRTLEAKGWLRQSLGTDGRIHEGSLCREILRGTTYGAMQQPQAQPGT